MGGLTGGLRGDLENVKSLLQNELALKTGGLEKKKNEEIKKMKNKE